MNSNRQDLVVPVPIVLVGCGAVSKFFYANALRVLVRRGMVKVDAVVDPSTSNARELGQLLSTTRMVASLDELEVRRSHLVIVASPPRFHAAQSIHALKQGAAVLCEKPMASNSIEAQEMIDTAAANKAPLAIGLYKRFFPACETIKSMIEKQSLGRLLRFRIDEGGKFTWAAASDSFFNKSVTPGGVLYDLGAHALDMLLWWLDEPVAFTYEDDSMGGVEANCAIKLEFRNGCRGEVRLSRDWPTTNTYTFFFERGTVCYKVNQANHLEINVDGMPSLLQGALTEYSWLNDHLIEHEPARSDAQSFIRQIVNLIRAQQGQEELRVPGTEGIRSLRLIEQCYARKTLMPMPWLSPVEDSAAKRLVSGSSLSGGKT